MAISGPQRAFGKGEAKSQNAVIKVYSASELRVALTKVYQLRGGVGTIEIAGDIVITEPIVLRQFNSNESQPREIIIQAVAGARIVNGRTVQNDAGYFYNQTNNTNIPVFDFGKVLGFDPTFDVKLFSVCKYTFKDLIINSYNSTIPFGALIAADTYGTLGYVATTTVVNVTAYNIWNIYAGYDSTNATTGINALSFNNKIDGFKYCNRPGNLITTTSLNNLSFSQQNGLFNNIGIAVLANIADVQNKFRIINNSNFSLNNISSVSAPVTIISTVNAVTGSPQFGTGNVISGATIENSEYDTGFSYITTSSTTNAINTVFATSSALGAVSNISEARITDAALAFLENTQAVNTTYTLYSNGNGALMRLDDLPNNSFYEVTWALSVKYAVSGLINNYCFKSSVRTNAVGVGTIINNSTIYASEEVVGTLIGIIPFFDALNTTFAIAPSDTTPLRIQCTLTVIINGLRLPIAG